MSWNNVIPWKVWDCMYTCRDRDPSTGFTVHVPECKLGQEIAERELEKICPCTDMFDFCRCKVFGEQEQHERPEDRKRDTQEPEGVGDTERQTRSEGVESGSSDTYPDW